MMPEADSLLCITQLNVGVSVESQCRYDHLRIWRDEEVAHRRQSAANELFDASWLRGRTGLEILVMQTEACEARSRHACACFSSRSSPKNGLCSSIRAACMRSRV